MTSVCAKILADKEDRLWFAGMIVIAANAGGAWSPLGDVTTTMLWIGGQITALNIIKELIFPSLVACGIPLLLMARRFKGINFIPSPFQERPLKEKKKRLEKQRIQIEYDELIRSEIERTNTEKQKKIEKQSKQLVL